MKKPLVVVIHHRTGTDIHYTGDIDVVSVSPHLDRDRVYRYAPTSASFKAMQHFVGPKKFWSNLSMFAPYDPDGSSRSRAALDPKNKLTLYPNGAPDLTFGRSTKKAGKKVRAKFAVPRVL